MPKNICSVENCGREAKNRSARFCVSHWTQWRQYGDPLATKPTQRASDVLCSLEGCIRGAYCRGWCRRHYRKWQRHGDPLGGEAEPRKSYGPICTVEDCVRPHATKGFCTMHYTRWRKHGDPLTVLPSTPPPNRVCATEGCDNKHSSRGLCKGCYQQWRIRNHPEGLTCELDDNALYADGLCWKHYTKWTRSGYVIGPPKLKSQPRALCERCGKPRGRKKARGERQRRFCKRCIQFRTCRRCNNEFDAGETNFTFCEECRFEDFSDYYSWWASNNRAYFRKRAAVRRAITNGAEAEDFTHEEIFERDDWQCMIPDCLHPGQPVDPNLEYPHPRSPSLDHIIPINPKIGGQHTRDNVRCSHLHCNAVRGDARGEQLVLIP